MNYQPTFIPYYVGIVSVGVSQLCLSRLHLMDVYERLCNLSSKPLPYRDIISSVEKVSGLCADLTPGPMTAWLEVFQLEVDILNNFLQAAANMQTWRFFESLMLVQSGSERMGRWAEIIKVLQCSGIQQALDRFWLNYRRERQRNLALWIVYCEVLVELPSPISTSGFKN